MKVKDVMHKGTTCVEPNTLVSESRSACVKVTSARFPSRQTVDWWEWLPIVTLPAARSFPSRYSGILLKLVGAIEGRRVGGCGQAAPNPSIGAFASIILASSSSSSPPLAKIVTSCRPPSFRMRRTRFDNTIRSPLSRRTARTAIPACFRRGASLTTFRAAASVS